MQLYHVDIDVKVRVIVDGRDHPAMSKQSAEAIAKGRLDYLLRSNSSVTSKYEIASTNTNK